MTRAPGKAKDLRNEQGCIVTLRRRDDGELSTHHVHGLVTVGLPAFLAHRDSRVYAVQAISTPRTIARDLELASRAVTWESSNHNGVGSETMTMHRTDHMMSERMTLARCKINPREWIPDAAA